MKKQPMYIDILNVKIDNRGYLFNVPEQLFEFINKIEEIHLANIKPDGIRGNHYHSNKKEALIVNYNDSWTFAWALKGSVEINFKKFSGNGHILIELDKNVCHAIKNIGKEILTITSFADKKYSHDNPDTFQIKLFE